MNVILNHSERPRKNITGPTQAHPAYWAQQPEAIVHPVGAALKRCFMCVSLEGE